MSSIPILLNSPPSLQRLADTDFQAVLLEGVSRTFALTIPQLPAGLYGPVANAYLLCRIVDTIEDEVSLSAERKKYFCSQFTEVVKTGRSAAAFARELAPELSSQTLPAEHALIRVSPRVVAITHGFDAYQRRALADCVNIMANGMPLFQSQNLHGGLPDLADLNRYCYVVAGCVGEMLAKLFCHYSPDMARQEVQLLALSVSFGQGLQMTNILKDIWDDIERGVCWLPQDVFAETGFDLKKLTFATDDERFRQGLSRLIGIAYGHLRNALAFTKLIPRRETGIRNFCLWALGMAVLTLRKIKQNLDFKRSDQVKISRKSVKATILATRMLGRSNTLLTLLFEKLGRELETPGWR